jgi:hypothetical protein
MGAINRSPLNQTIKKAILEWNIKSGEPAPLPLMDDVDRLSYAIEEAVHGYLKTEIGNVIRRSGE